MEKLLGAHKTLIQAEADITTARLGITGQCSDDKRPLLNVWLKQVAALPILDPKPHPEKDIPSEPHSRSDTGH
ncbi:hypothetical protein ACTL6P_14810 [Endozoicomonas acroporae]|uniref:hypothetical protein n=1 Tax=Endozoicomonas acroporae TaxID=1701104 RepID=UPI000C782C40|nr:hypothetical protein [Endozoicomonas acroporae]